jgi:hypothetical protein
MSVWKWIELKNGNYIRMAAAILFSKEIISISGKELNFSGRIPTNEIKKSFLMFRLN